jgi:hypothetical protein
MSPLHPKLCVRETPNPYLKRPAIEHPVLGHLEYINRDGGWWQTMTRFSGCLIRLDLQSETRVSQSQLDSAAVLLTWLQTHEPQVRDAANQKLMAGDYRNNVNGRGPMKLAAPKFLDGRRLQLIALWSDHCDLYYDCEGTSDEALFGAHTIEVSFEERVEDCSVLIFARSISDRAKILLEREVPHEDRNFINRLPDQFVSRTAKFGARGFDDQLRATLRQAIEDLDKWMQTASIEFKSYLRSVHLLLVEVAQNVDTKETRPENSTS